MTGRIKTGYRTEIREFQVSPFYETKTNVSVQTNVPKTIWIPQYVEDKTEADT